jgi:hypothetical protein
MNNTGTSCTFVYYKEYKDPSFNTNDPPYSLSCTGSNKWLDRFGVPDAAGKTHNGVEWDWLGFLYYLNQRASTTLTMQDFSTLYGLPPTPDPWWADPPPGPQVHFSELANNADQRLSPAKAAQFRLQGNTFGVNH